MINVLLFLLVSIILVIYLKKTWKVNIEYSKSKNIVEEVILSFNKEIEGLKQKIEEFNIKFQNLQLPDMDQVKSELDSLSSKIEDLLGLYSTLEKKIENIEMDAYKGTIKAFHWHKKQDDLWFVATGKAIVVLHDLRDNSPTKDETQIITAGKDDYKLIVIPRGVAHGYKVLSEEPVLLFYHTTEPYNPRNPDEGRMSFDDSRIGFDWNIGVNKG